MYVEKSGFVIVITSKLAYFHTYNDNQKHFQLSLIIHRVVFTAVSSVLTKGQTSYLTTVAVALKGAFFTTLTGF